MFEEIFVAAAHQHRELTAISLEEVAEALGQLSAADVPMAVCTSKRQDFAIKILELFGVLIEAGAVS